MRVDARRLERIRRHLAIATGELLELQREREAEKTERAALLREITVLRSRKGAVGRPERRKAAWQERYRVRKLYARIG